LPAWTRNLHSSTKRTGGPLSPSRPALKADRAQVRSKVQELDPCRAPPMLSRLMMLPSPIEAVVFDLDGTLIDSFPDIRAACNHTLERLGRPALTDPVIRSFVGRGSRRLVASALGVQPEDALVNEALAIFLDYYEAHPVDLTVPRPGALELIELFGARAMAICTNKPARITARVVEA